MERLTTLLDHKSGNVTMEDMKKDHEMLEKEHEQIKAEDSKMMEEHQKEDEA